MDIFLREIQLGKIRIELSVQEKDGCTVIFTAKDSDDAILWKSAVTDENGKIIVYPTVEDAFNDAENRLKVNS